MKNILIVFLIFYSSIFAASIKDDAESILYSNLGSSINLEFIKYKIPNNIKKEIESESRQQFSGDFVYFYKIFKNEKLINIAVIDNVYGKSMPITFLVIYNLDSNIIFSGIVKYREQYGSGVKSEEWNEQFIGKNSNSNYEIGQDISAISGATISANSIAKGIKKTSLLIDKIKDQL